MITKLTVKELMFLIECINEYSLIPPDEFIKNLRQKLIKKIGEPGRVL
jgi:hypothetical protein